MFLLAKCGKNHYNQAESTGNTPARFRLGLGTGAPAREAHSMEKRKTQRVTLAKVAERAGVAESTASRVRGVSDSAPRYT